jgi:succinyl-CoA synthetase alpha subunit
MAILVDHNTRVICQGMTGRQGSFHVQRALDKGTNVVAGVVPGKGGQTHLGLPVFDTVASAVAATEANASMVFVPPPAAAYAIIESIQARLPVVTCVTERIPMIDMVRVKRALKGAPTRLIGPNSIGVFTPGQCRMGVMPLDIATPGCIGLVSRAGTLSYEAIAQTSAQGLGQSTCVGIGADMIRGIDFIDCLKLFAEDDETRGVVMLGEVGGSAEEDAALYLKQNRYPKPVVAYIAGQFAPPGRRMGHAGAIVMPGSGTARSKINRLMSAGVHIADSPMAIGATMTEVLN